MDSRGHLVLGDREVSQTDRGMVDYEGRVQERLGQQTLNDTIIVSSVILKVALWYVASACGHHTAHLAPPFWALAARLMVVQWSEVGGATFPGLQMLETP